MGIKHLHYVRALKQILTEPFQSLHKASINIPILCVRKLRLRDVKYMVLGHIFQVP